MFTFAALLLGLRFLASNLGQLTEGDEILIAEGVATMLNDSMGPLYRYGPQFGYYRLVEFLAGIGGGVSAVPVVMVLLSVVAGAVIPTVALLAFPSDLDNRDRWLVAALLAVNPLIWTSAAYGNTAMPSVAIATTALVVLSRRPAQRGEVIAMALFALAVFVRADAVLLTPALGLLLWRTHNSVMAAVRKLIMLGAAIAAVYAILLITDPLMAGFASAIADHRDNVFQTLFWDYLLWALSPFPLLFAVVGLIELESRRRWLLAILLVWCLPVFLFYFGNTTAPRYHLNAIFPLSVAGAFGVVALAQRSGRFRRLTLGLALIPVFAHAFVAVGRFTPGTPRSWLTEGSIPSHDGSFPTGALLYKTFRLDPPDLGQLLSFRYDLQGSQRHWVDLVRSGDYAGRRVIVIADGVYSPYLHWSAEVSGFEVRSWNRDGASDCIEFGFFAAGVKVVTSDRPRIRDNPGCRLQAAVGDEVWLIRPTGRDALLLISDRLPTGVHLAGLEDREGLIARYTVATDQ
ncbi:MAG: hypothetical protein ACT4OZ_17070 [Gemmatimonadota bacterium]